MSGPIVRKYGFPNFDKIFGPKPVLHGVEDEPKADAKDARDAESPRDEAEPAKGRPAVEDGPSR